MNTAPLATQPIATRGAYLVALPTRYAAYDKSAPAVTSRSLHTGPEIGAVNQSAPSVQVLVSGTGLVL